MKFVWEHNGNDSLLYSVDYVGAYTRGETLDIAINKMQSELEAYAAWKNQKFDEHLNIEIIQEKNSELNIADADSDVLFDCELSPLAEKEYNELKALVLKSATDFHLLYTSIPNKNASCLAKRKTFYGDVPITAQEMYDHTKNVNSYYFGEIGIDVNNEGTIYTCRKKGFELLELTKSFTDNPVIEGSYGELWSLRKVMRRFIWHDRIHAKAMYRMAIKTFGAGTVENPFKFIIR